MLQKSDDSQKVADIIVSDILEVLKYPKMNLDATATSASPGTYQTVVDLSGHGVAKIRWEFESDANISGAEEAGIKVTIDGNVLEMVGDDQHTVNTTYFNVDYTFEFQSSFKFEVRSADDGGSTSYIYTGWCIYGYHTAL